MAYSPGDRLGPYRILALVGKGGMGEVYRAHDDRLHRDVAIKVASAQFSERFTREARAIAALNHTNICHLYDVGPNYLVMEFVEGEDLRGPLDFEDVLPIVKQLIDGIEAAHEKNIVHRDLKPANIKITPEGVVKILDFGLAKAMEAPASQDGNPENSPTLTIGATEAGTILGTAAYMAPEQAKGKVADKRSDIWSFGVILYELLTGERLFSGETAVEILGAVLNRDLDISAAPRRTHKLLRWCLEKDRRQRLASISDARRVLGEETSVDGWPAHSRPRSGWVAWGVAALSVAAAGVFAFVHFREQRPEPRLSISTILPPEDTTFNFNSDNPLAISPDGRRIVFGVRSNAKSQLWVRPLDSPVAQPLEGTENAQFPFWSPDSRSIGFFADRKLKRIDVAGGPAVTIAEAPIPRGGAWSPDGTIVYSANNPGGLQRVSAAGGTVSPATAFDAAKDRSHRFPWFLPDGRHFLFEDQLQLGSNDDMLRIGSLDSQEVKTIGPSNSNAMYAQGYLLFLRENTLVAQPFDENRLATTGDAAPVGQRVQTAVPAGSVGVFCVSRDGLLMYQTGSGAAGLQLTWFDRTGKPMGTLGEPGNVYSLEFSPDRKSVAVTVSGQNSAVWIYDAARGLRARLTFDPGVKREALWAPDERSIVYSSDQKVHSDLYRKPTDLNGTGEVLYADGAPKTPSSWSRDGKFLLFTRNDPKTADGIWVLPMTPDAAGKPSPFLQTSFDEGNARFSPDGKWVAYVSYESGRPEVYGAPFPGPGGKRQISTAGGLHPRWRDDGKELFYEDPGGILMAAEIAAKAGTIDVGAVRSLGISVVTSRGWTYDVTADGQRFLVAARPEQKSSEPLTLVSNWTLLLRK